MGCQDTLLTSFVWSRTTTDEDFDDTAVNEHADIQFRTRCLSRCDIISQFRVEQDAHTYADTDTDADADADADAGVLLASGPPSPVTAVGLHIPDRPLW